MIVPGILNVYWILNVCKGMDFAVSQVLGNGPKAFDATSIKLFMHAPTSLAQFTSSDGHEAG
jgi:hypothetical protein